MAFKSFNQGIDRRIINLNFGGGISGLLFVRCHWIATSPSISITPPVATVKDLTYGGEFNFFDVVAPLKDPKVDETKVKSKSIVNPVTDDMLTLYRHWQPNVPITDSSSKSTPNGNAWFIDQAVWEGSYKSRATSQVAYGFREVAEEEMWNAFQQSASAPVERRFFGSSLTQYWTGSYLADIPPPPDPLFFQIAASSQPPWTYHQEDGGSSTEYKTICDAVMLFNLTKMRLSQKVDPITKKKPDDCTFTIGVPPVDDSSKSTKFEVSAGSYKSSKPSVPPKDTDGRRDYPLHDLPDPDGMQHLAPNWTPFPNKPDKGSPVTVDGIPTGDLFVTVKVTFGKNLKVELSREGSADPINLG